MTATYGPSDEGGDRPGRTTPEASGASGEAADLAGRLLELEIGRAHV